MDYLDELDLCVAPLQFAEAEVTPGWHRIFVLDLRTNRLVREVVKVDCDLGMVWERFVGGGRAHPRSGQFAIIATNDVIKQYKDQWKSSQ